MKVYILGGLRTPIVVSGTKFKNIRPEMLGAEVLKSLQKKFHLKHVDEVICGNAVGTGGNISRLMTLLAGFDEKTAALTVDRQCASGAAAISIAFSKISCGISDLIIAGGVESASLQPLRVYNCNDERFFLTKIDDIQGAYRTAQFSPNEFGKFAMIKGAQRVADAENFSKNDLDAWALISHRRAAASIELLREFIIETKGIREDTAIKKNISQKILDRAPLPLGKGTKISAGNACRINDGAAFVVLASEKFVFDNFLSPAAEILDVATGGVNPLESPRGAQLISDKILKKNALTYENLAAIEFNEAFAVIDLLFERNHPNCVEKFNKLGGALAYGHPYGASGAILMINLLAALKNSGGLGLLGIAGAGGTGESILIKV